MARIAHSTLSGTDLHGPFHYEQTSDPGAVGAGKYWLNTSTFVLSERNGANSAWQVIATSVTLTMPAEFSVAGSPVAGVGTLAVTKATETANTVWAGPTSGSAAQPTFRAMVPADMARVPYVQVMERQTAGTEGGTFTTGAWRTRTLNVTGTDSASISSLSSNQLTLPAGTYLCNIAAPAYACNSHVIRLQNITGSATLLTGTAARSTAASSVMATSVIVGQFVLGGSTAIEVQHSCETTSSTTGLGISAGSRANPVPAFDIYTVAEFWKVA